MVDRSTAPLEMFGEPDDTECPHGIPTGMGVECWECRYDQLKIDYDALEQECGELAERLQKLAAEIAEPSIKELDTLHRIRKAVGDTGKMINEMTMIIPGVPIAKKRPRFARRGKFVTTYNSQETEEGRWLLGARESFRKNGITEPLNVPIGLWMIFYMPIPKSATKKQLEAIREHPKHTKKPDIDNLQKFALDCLNGELFTDDALVWSINAFKAYHEKPGTYIKVSW